MYFSNKTRKYNPNQKLEFPKVPTPFNLIMHVFLEAKTKYKCPSVRMSVHISVCLSICLSVRFREKRDFLGPYLR